MILSIDPGTDACGVAAWRDNGTLIRAELVKAHDYRPGLYGRKEMAAELYEFLIARIDDVGAGEDRHLITEYPQTYGGHAGKGDTNDLLSLCSTIGYFERDLNRHFRTITEVLPSRWKGQIPKPKSVKDPYIVQERVKAELRPHELACVTWPGNKKLQWDVADAIGIGLWHFKRAFK